MLAIVVALQSEAEFFIQNVDIEKEFLLGGKKVIEGKVENKKIVLSICGIGKVNSALATQMLIDKYSPDYVLNFGTCGGVDNSVTVGSFYNVEKCCQFDFDVSSLDPVPVGYIQDYDSVYFYPNTNLISSLPLASLASADRFSDSKEDNQLIKNMGCNLRDMEGGAIGEVCTSNGVPFIMIKGVTDVYGNGTSGEQFYNNSKLVCKGFKEVIKKVIADL